ncbi:uncharacterized protein [Procambarus clarkii]|uniref:uncharacterized protein n=1 Tax=Procambarus clarkii TaxID=6728 RepID=UPI00374389C1
MACRRTRRLAAICKHAFLIVLITLLCRLALVRIADEAPRRTGEDSRGKIEAVGDDVVTPEEINQALEKLKIGLSRISIPCRRLVRMGGKLTCSCETKKCSVDGAKLVCLDEGVRPRPGRCFALSFGIGFETSFDEALVNYGCRVIALDPTNSNITNVVHDVSITDKLRPVNKMNYLHHRKFHALNLGIDAKASTMILNITTDGVGYLNSIASFVTYKAILDTLDNPRVDLLKIDIEGVEWRVLKQLLSSPDARHLLEHTRQILLEVHLDFLVNVANADDIFDGTITTLSTLRLLEQFGFYIAAYDLNETGQKYFVFKEVKIPLYRELTLVKRFP